MAATPRWRITGDWFDVCNCRIPCPCTWAQAPTDGTCEGILAWTIRSGHYGDRRLDGLNFVMVGAYEGDMWTGATGGRAVVFMDERASDEQRQAMGLIFTGQAGGWPARHAELLRIEGDTETPIEVASIDIEVAGDLRWWRVEIPGRVVARAEVLTGPTTPEGALVQVLNVPGSDTGPGQVSTWGRSVEHRVDLPGFSWEWNDKSSKHIPFDWSGPDGV